MNGYEKRVLLAEDDQGQRNLMGLVLGNAGHNDPEACDNATHWSKSNVGNLMLWWCPINGLQLILLEVACSAKATDDSTVG